MSLLYNQARGGRCRVYSSDLRVRVLQTGLATYTDVTVICGDVAYDPDSAVTATNPTVIIEVTSPSTEEFDRGEKREHYGRIPSLRAYVLVAHDGESWSRTEDGWHARSYTEGRVELAADLGLDVEETYAGVSF